MVAPSCDFTSSPITGLQYLLDVPLGRHLAADGQEVDDDVGARLAQDAGDVGGRAGGLLDHLGQVGPEAVVSHPAVYGHAELRYRGEAHRVVRLLADRLAEVLADLAGVDVEGRRELDVADVVGAEPRVHEAGDERIVRRLSVVVDTLHEGGCTVADADDGDSNGSHSRPPGARRDAAERKIAAVSAMVRAV
jgi:hypothetical protein